MKEAAGLESLRLIDSALYLHWKPKMTLLKEFLASDGFSNFTFHGSILVGGCLLFYAGYWLGTRRRSQRWVVDCQADLLKEDLDFPQPKLLRSVSSSSMATNDEYEKESSPVGDSYRLALIIRKDCGLRRGQTIIHCCRAFLGEFKKLYKDRNPDLKEWEHDGHTVVVLRALNEQEMISVKTKSKSIGVESHFFCDKQPNGTSLKTVLALGPAKSNIIRELTQHLYRL